MIVYHSVSQTFWAATHQNKCENFSAPLLTFLQFFSTKKWVLLSVIVIVIIQNNKWTFILSQMSIRLVFIDTVKFSGDTQFGKHWSINIFMIIRTKSIARLCFILQCFKKWVFIFTRFVQILFWFDRPNSLYLTNKSTKKSQKHKKFNFDV